MSHPFFNALEYPFHRPDGMSFFNALKSSIKKNEAILLLYEQCQADLPDLATSGVSPTQVWREALHSLVANGALRKLCELAALAVQGGAMQEAVAAVIAAQGEENDVLLSGGIVVLDRAHLRLCLAELASEQKNLGVLVVKGEKGSGKTYSNYLFQHLAKIKGADAVLIYEGVVVTVEDAISMLYSAIKAPAQCPAREAKHTTDKAWYRDVCIHFQGTIAKLSVDPRATQQLWIAVDNLGIDSDKAPLMDRRIRDFFDCFALYMNSSVFRKYFRLLLIDYPDDPSLSKWDKFSWKADQLSSASINEQDITVALRAWGKQHQKLLFDHDIQKHAAHIITTAEASSQLGAGRVSCIADELQKILEVL